MSQDELRSLFEAARWAPSSYNEQPWRYFVATRDGRAQFERLLSCLLEGNQGWAMLRQRKPLKEFVFTGKWGNPAPFLAKR